jgi:hypothetical protein
MFDAETTALLRAVLEDVCESVSCYETAARTHVASMILEAASKGETSVDGLKQIGRSALRGAPMCGIDCFQVRGFGIRPKAEERLSPK